MNITPNSVDGMLFFILFIFAFLAFLKGFVKEFFSTLNLIIATFLSYTASPYVSKLFFNTSAPQMIIDVGVQFIVFVVALIICSILSAKISHPLSDKMPDFLNQSLGFGFGFLKGYLIISFGFAVLLFFYSGQPLKNLESKIENSKNQEKFGPEWFRDSKSYDILDYGANLLKPVMDNAFPQIKNINNKNNDINDGTPKTDSELIKMLDTVKTINETQKVYEQLLKDDNNPTPTIPKVEETKEKKADPDNKKDDSGYTDQEIKKMKRLIEIMSN